MTEREPDLTINKLDRVRFATGLSIAFERIWPLLLPLLIVAATLLTLAWIGLFRAIPDVTRLALISLLSLAFLASLWPLTRFRWPTRLEVNARIESENALVHQPLSVQADKPAGDAGEVAKAFWREHQARMAQQLAGLQPASPQPRTHEHDRFALRTIPALTLAVAFAFSLGSGGGRVSDLWNGQAALPAIPPRIDAWVTPPRYTGKPPVFLTNLQDGASVTIPAGSELTVRVGAETSTEFALYENGKPLAGPSSAAATPEAIKQAVGQVLTAKLMRDSALGLGTEAGLIKAWQFKVIADNPPEIAWSAEPSTAKNGTVTLAYTVKDDYGVTKGAAKFTPEPVAPGMRPLYSMDDLPLSLPRRGTKENAAKIAKDLTQHPLAGESFAITLEAEDGAGHKAASQPKSFGLPSYYLANPLARAIAEDRRLLARDANAKPLVGSLLEALTLRPEETINNASHFLGIETARVRLRLARSDDELRDVADYLWQIALTIDKNSLSDAERRLKQAEDKLAEALENGASDEEIAKLMQELRQAMNEYMKELAEKGDQNNTQDQNGQELSSNELDKMLDKMEQLSKQGSKDKAKQLLDQLRNMMDNLQARKGKSGKSGQGQSQMEGKLNELGKMLRDQQKLMDDTFQEGRDQSNPGPDGQGEQGEGEQGQGEQGQNGQGGKPGGQSGHGGLGQLQERQNGLAGRLDGLMKGLKDLGIDPGQELGNAGKSMGRAGRKLGEGDTQDAIGEQQQALDALRKGAEGLMEQMRQAMGEQGGGEQQGQKGSTQNDPLGRPRATEGPDFGQSTKVPDEIDVQRAREILEAIRKRLGNALSPELERQYLERLLNFE